MSECTCKVAARESDVMTVLANGSASYHVTTKFLAAELCVHGDKLSDLNPFKSYSAPPI